MFRLYEDSEYAAHNNAFISGLFNSIVAYTKSQDKKLNASERLKNAKDCASFAENSIARLLMHVRTPLPEDASKEKINNRYECILWLKHRAWTFGSFATTIVTLRDLGEGELQCNEMVEKIEFLRREIDSIKVTTTTGRLSPEQRNLFDRNYIDFRRHAQITYNFVSGNSGTVARKKALLKTLGSHLVSILSDIMQCGELQNKFSNSEHFQELQQAMKLVVDVNSEEVEIEHRTELMSMWTTVSSLSDMSDLSASIANKVNDSIKQCENYSKRNMMGKATQWIDEQLKILDKKLVTALKAVKSRMDRKWTNGAQGVVATIFWILVAPVLGIADGVNYLRGKKSNYLGDYNKFICDSWSKNTTRTFLCLLGVTGIVAPVVGAVSWSTAKFGYVFGAGFGAYVSNSEWEKESKVIKDAHEAERSELMTFGQLKLEDAKSKMTQIDHDKTFKKFDRLGKMFYDCAKMDGETEDDTDTPPLLPEPSPILSGESSNAELTASKEHLQDIWNNLTDVEVRGMQSDIMKDKEDYGKQLAKLDDDQVRATENSSRHSLLLSSIDWTQLFQFPRK